MPESINTLCAKLISTEDTAKLQPVAAELQSAISGHVERVRKNAIDAFEFAFKAEPGPVQR